jgi:putative heme-binding domain-containing protein
VAFNEDDEMFTYEADNERDIGNPWYKPSRVHHLVSGGDYAWRRGTGVLPSHAPDVLPTMHDVGLGSPTGVEMGTGAKFPEKYRRALFIADWAYGRILALHLTPRGASYTATREEFAMGRPLNVTDMAVGPDGALYFTTGGRGTQSGLYRIRYGGKLDGSERAALDQAAAELRQLRQRLEAFHARDRAGDPAPVLAAVWPQLGHADRWIRHAARVALETVNPREWRERALGEKDADRALTALLALARLEADRAAIVARLDAMPLAEFSETQLLGALRIYEIALPGLAALELATAATKKLAALYPARSGSVNRELCKLLVNLRAPDFLGKTTALLAAAETQEDRVHFLFFLRHASGPWTIEQRRVFFDAVQKAELGQGAQNYVGTVRAIKSAAAATLTVEERATLAPWLEDKSIVASGVAADRPAPHFVREWPLEELEAVLSRVGTKRSFERGRAAFDAAQCRACHRMGAEGGVFGPDLTAVASRFGRRDLLVAILDPSRAMDEKYRNTIVRLKDGSQVVGVVESESAQAMVLRPNPLGADTVEVPVAKIATSEPSAISPMPTGLLNTLQRDEILDLLAYLEAGGNPNHPAFGK